VSLENTPISLLFSKFVLTTAIFNFDLTTGGPQVLWKHVKA
jgi:hypothetical protein